MGSGQTKDGFVDMFLQTTQQIYLPGSYVEGIVHINCKDNRNYSLLQLRLKGVEHVAWSEGSGKHRRHYSNTKETYNSCFEIAVFQERVFPAGHYSFPFKFILPSQITGSLFESENTYIRYHLISQLVPSDQKNDLQKFVKNLNIIEPFREVTGAIQKDHLSNPECCCCKKYGMVKVSMQCDKNFVKAGDKIYVTGNVDNSAGTEQITNCQISFQDCRWKISSGGAARLNILGNHPLFVIPTPVLPGERREFSFSAIIPQGLNYSTAIGSVVSRYHVLNFSSHMGCCSVGPTCEFLLVYNSASQVLEVGPQVPPPPGWRPKVANQVLYNNFPPFHYQPTPGIPYLNRAGMTNVTNLAVMNNEMGYYQQTQANTMSQMPRVY